LLILFIIFNEHISKIAIADFTVVSKTLFRWGEEVVLCQLLGVSKALLYWGEQLRFC